MTMPPVSKRRWKQSWLWVLPLVLLAAVFFYDRNAVPNAKLKACEVAAIHEVANRTALRPDELRAEAHKDGDDWRVLVWRLPETPGAHYFLTYSDDGNLKAYEPGE